MNVSLLIVHYGDPALTKKCLKSIYESDLSNLKYEILILDNTPNVDNEKSFKKFKNLQYFKTGKNNYTRALNIGINKSRGEFLVFLNQDIQMQRNWLKELLNTAGKNKKIGAVMSKQLFSESKKINSIGIEEIENYYFRDTGYNENDRDLPEQKIDLAPGGCTLYRKSALQEAGMIDEDFSIYLDDVEISKRLKDYGYEIMLCPKSVVYHEMHGTIEKGSKLPYYFCNRNRLLLLAKRKPRDLAKQIKNSHTFLHKEYDYLYKFVNDAIIKLVKENDPDTVNESLSDIMHEIAPLYPIEKLQNILNKVELLCKTRKPKICFYDHALHFPGGGQKYGLTIAEAIQNDYDVTLMGNKNVSRGDLESWYNLDLEKCHVKIVDLPLYENVNLINPTLAENADLNPFYEVEEEIMDYDLLVNVNMTPHVNPHSLKSIFLCHFPDGKVKNHFYVGNYDKLIANSKYTLRWIEKNWNLEATEIIYPPVDMEYKNNDIKKENIILSVARFEESGTKKQYEMARIFVDMCKKNKNLSQSWKLILAGGGGKNSPYFNKINKFVQSSSNNIEIYRNLANKDLQKLYANAKIFWHACGLNEDIKKYPQRIEHFGMTTVEAMQNKCVPVVINGGGQREIISHGKNGFRFSNENQLRKYTLKLINKSALLEKLKETAYKDSKKYNKEQFQNKFKSLIEDLIDDIYTEMNKTPEIHKAINPQVYPESL